MIHSATQLKAIVKNKANGDSNKSLVLIRKFIMERFLERLSVSEYKNQFIIKGGILVSSMVGIDNRDTMDIDTTIRGFDLNEETLKKILTEIAEIPMEDGITFKITKVSEIMDDFEYPGIRVMMVAMLDKMRTPLKLDISTNDVITPKEIEYKYPLTFEERSIDLLSYNLETVLAEKLETILSRGEANTRMRDFYDIAIFTSGVYREPDYSLLKTALIATADKRGTSTLLDRRLEIIGQIENDADIQKHWKEYQESYDYALMFSLANVIDAINKLYDQIGY
jgi:predicted nucleotidyltransferase component of viral defense system